MRRFSVVILSLITLWAIQGGLSGSLHAQTLFQNNNTPCEDIPVPPFVTKVPLSEASITCGRFNDDSALGQTDFPDCGAVADPITVSTPTPQPVTNTILINTGAHGQNCVNAGEPNPQFNSTFLQDQDFFPSAVDTVTRMGTIANGNLNNGEFNDLAMIRVATDTDTPSDSRPVESLFSQAGGGFGSGLISSSSTAQLGFDGPNALVPFPAQFLISGVSNNDSTDHSLVLLDCDGDGLDEAVVSVRDPNSPDQPGFVVLQNDGSGLEDHGASDPIIRIPLGTGAATNWHISLAKGNFLGDANLDIAVAFAQENGGPDDRIVLCRGLGGCGFSCPTDPGDSNVFNYPNGVLAGPNSIAAGDFNGDGLTDVAVTELNSNGSMTLGQLRYFFNSGGSLNSWAQVTKSLITSGNVQAIPHMLVTGKFTTTAFQQNIDEIAVSVIQEPNGTTALQAGVEVFTTDGLAGINDPVLLSPSQTFDFSISSGIDAKNFDHCGGDDIVFLNSGLTLPSTTAANASVFLNANEAPDVSIDPGAPTQSAIGQAVNIPTTCTDPTLDDRIFDWTVLTSPPGSTVTFGRPTGSIVDPSTDASSTFKANAEGDYTIQVTCTDFCGLSDTASTSIHVIFRTQGGCIASLNGPVSDNGKWIWALVLLVPALLLFRRIGRKGVVVSVVALALLLSASSAHALTKSFSVNSFQPTVDDSEYFTVYNSPTMLKRNYHVGFFLDFAHDPYEFGDNDFNRVGGIVDDLLTGNIFGSYAVLDWLSVGALIPVYFWEGIRSNNPALLLNQNNFDLGDVQLVLKFRLLDREKHHIGIAVVPYMVFPTSTGATSFLGNGSFNGGIKLVIDGRIKDRVSLALNTGYVMQSNITDIGGNNLDDQFLASLGISVDILKKKLMFISEGQVATVAKDFFSARRTTPAEARAGFRYTFANNHDINAGAGFGLSNGISSPSWRGFIGYTYTKRPVAEVAVPPPPVSEINVGDELTLKDKIYFEFDKAVIRDISKPTLDKIAGFLKAHPEITKIRIDGYTCDLGSNSYNKRLSQKRAQAVVTYLQGQDISADRIGTVTGYGEENPLVPNVDEPHREQNRRVQIFVEAMDKSLTPGAPPAESTK